MGVEFTAAAQSKLNNKKLKEEKVRPIFSRRRAVRCA
jgi:hypothetical protein